MEIRLKEMGSIDQTEAISRDEIDLGFGHGHARRSGIEGFLYHSEPFVACLHESHPLAKRRKIGLSQLSQDDFVLFARHGSPAYYELIVNACVAAGFAPKVRHEVAYWLTVLALVATGTGVALVPRSLRDSRLAGLCFVGLENAMDDANAAGLRHGNGQAGLGNRIHGGRDNRNVERDRPRQLGRQVDPARHDGRMTGTEQHIIEGQRLGERHLR
jgi:DNA-binding transcriptional LysR family regulator